MSEEKQAIKEQAKNASGMLPCPFCGKKLILSHKFADHPNGYLKWFRFHPDNKCILRYYSIDLSNTEKVEAWNTRKPMENIVERLKEEAYHLEETEYHHSMVVVDIDDAIEIIKGVESWE